jgi:nucleotide-binding universal stress UspA family protein
MTNAHAGRRTQPDRSQSGSGGPRLGHAVVGFDGSLASYDALAFATGWACRVGAQLDVVHVTDLSWQWVADACGAMSLVAAVPDSTLDLSAEVAAAMTGFGLPWVYRAASGGVAHELECHAKKLSADAIIIGRSRRRVHVLRSSISHRLLSCADRIVIVVP